MHYARTTGGHWRITVVSCALILVSGGADSASLSVDWPFMGCEADDVGVLAEQARPWASDPHRIGPWSLGHQAALSCNVDSCGARLTAFVEHPSLSLSQASIVDRLLALDFRDRHETQRFIAEQEAAASLLAHLGPAAFEADGATRRVFIDYGKLADVINLRIRTEISCLADGPYCLIEAHPIAYISYAGRGDCGAIAERHDAIH